MAVEPSSGQSKILLLANAIANKITSLITVHNADSSAHSTILTNYIQKSSTSGLVKNDGSVDTTSYLSSLPSHTHTKSEITNFKHEHNISDVAILQAALNTKADKSHTHTTSEIKDFTHTHSAATLETDGFLSMQDKAKLDNLSYDSGWQEVTFKPGYTKYNNSTSVYIRRKGDLVELNGVWKTTSKKNASYDHVPFASIPDELKPTKNVSTICFGQGKNTYMLTVNGNTLYWSRYGVSTNAGLDTGDFGNVHCMWTI